MYSMKPSRGGGLRRTTRGRKESNSMGSRTTAMRSGGREQGEVQRDAREVCYADQNFDGGACTEGERSEAKSIKFVAEQEGEKSSNRRPASENKRSDQRKVNSRPIGRYPSLHKISLHVE